MSSYQTLTGRFGKVSTAPASINATPPVSTSIVARVSNWAVNPTLASDTQWGDSGVSGEAASLRGFTNRAAGRRDCTFTCEGRYDTNSEIFDLWDAEDILAVTLWQDFGSRAGGSDIYWDFPRALCNDFNLTVDVDTEEVIGWSSSFGADGVFYKPGDSSANDGNPIFGS